ncbi:MAG: FG-GAP-like repeat-containing protein [Bacteroidota bacterium]
MRYLQVFSLVGWVLSGTLSAQTLSEVQTVPFAGVRYSAVVLEDLNGDGHPDVFLCGQDSTNQGISRMYFNDGQGQFMEEMNLAFDGVLGSSVAVKDLNGDGFPDLLLTGSNSFSVPGRIAKLYLNDGVGNFTEQPNTPFVGVWFGTLTLEDFNGDTYPDIFLTGQDSSQVRITKLYINDGVGNFTEKSGTPFEGLRFSSVATADVNGDTLSDLLLTGQDSALNRIAKLYLNDGGANFTEQLGTPFTGVWESSVAITDVNADGHADVFLTGTQSSGLGLAKLYLNDGLGNFTEDPNVPFEGVWRSASAIADFDGDVAPDLLLSGENSVGQRISRVYLNDGNGSFSDLGGTALDGVRFGAIDTEDMNGDGRKDLFLTGENSQGELIAKLYFNEEGTTSVETSLEGPSTDLLISPNPASSLINLKFHAATAGDASIHILDMQGRVVFAKEAWVGLGEQVIPVELPFMSHGRYAIRLQINHQQLATVILVP